jgi:hypothetical protein
MTTQHFFPENMFAGVLTLGYCLKDETHNAPENGRLSTSDKFAGMSTAERNRCKYRGNFLRKSEDFKFHQIIREEQS